MGGLVKAAVGASHNKPVYHVTVMPCYDKKLEASRGDFIVNEEKEVDLVLGKLVYISNMKFKPYMVWAAARTFILSACF